MLEHPSTIHKALRKGLVRQRPWLRRVLLRLVETVLTLLGERVLLRGGLFRRLRGLGLLLRCLSLSLSLSLSLGGLGSLRLDGELLCQTLTLTRLLGMSSFVGNGSSQFEEAS